MEALTDEITLSVWIRRGASDLPESLLLVRRTPGTNRGIQHFLAIATDPGFSFSWSGVGQGSPEYEGYRPLQALNVYQTLNDGGWHHIAVTYRFGEGAEPSLYLDGQPVAGEFVFGTGGVFSPPSVSVPTRLGNQISASPSQYEGLLDDLQVYNVALSPEEIALLCDCL